MFCTFAIAAASTAFGSAPGAVGIEPIAVLCESFRCGCCAIVVCLAPWLEGMAVWPASDNPGPDAFAVKVAAARVPRSVYEVMFGCVVEAAELAVFGPVIPLERTDCLAV